MNREKPIDNLTACSIAAEKLGISYGKYMAMGYHPEVKQETPEPEQDAEVPEKMKVCAFCGKPFPAASRASKAIYCSNDCRQNAGKQKYMERYYRNKETAEKSGEIRYCAVCGNPMPEGRRAGSKTCSPECSVEWHRIVQRERYWEKCLTAKKAGVKNELEI